MTRVDLEEEEHQEETPVGMAMKGRVGLVQDVKPENMMLYGVSVSSAQGDRVSEGHPAARATVE